MELNDLQKVIVETEEPKVIVIASAAAGKTAVLTERLKYLLKKGVDPSKKSRRLSFSIHWHYSLIL